MPEISAIATSLVLHAARMSPPGANTSTHGPTLLKEESRSSLSIDATVIASGAEAGETKQALEASLPAATTTLTPVACSVATAWFSAMERPPPSDMATTAGAPSFAASCDDHSIPASTVAVVPNPLQSSTCTVTTLAALATPTARWVEVEVRRRRLGGGCVGEA